VLGVHDHPVEVEDDSFDVRARHGADSTRDIGVPGSADPRKAAYPGMDLPRGAVNYL
jgi:hypothetical protein